MNNIFTTRTMHGMSIHEIVQVNAACYYARELVHVPHVPPTPEELAECAKYDEEWEAYAKAHGYDEQPDWAHYGCYKTPEAAQRCIELHSYLSHVDDDMQAFNAPSECYSDATRDEIRELDQLEYQFGTRHPDEPKPNPYTERGLDDRTRPIRDSLPAGMTDDHDILAALGERSAL